MPKLSNLLAERAKAEIQVGGTTINFIYWAMWRERFSEEEHQSYVGMPFRQYIMIWLPRVIISWELVDDAADNSDFDESRWHGAIEEARYLSRIARGLARRADW